MEKMLYFNTIKCKKKTRKIPIVFLKLFFLQKILRARWIDFKLQDHTNIFRF